MTREEMLNNIIRKFGFEANETIRFADYIDRYKDDRALNVTYNWMMRKKILK